LSLARETLKAHFKKKLAQLIKFSLGDSVTLNSDDMQQERIVEVIEIYGNNDVEITARSYEDGDLFEEEIADDLNFELVRNGNFVTMPPKIRMGETVAVDKLGGAIGTVGYMYNRLATSDDQEFGIATEGQPTGWRYVVDFPEEVEGDDRSALGEHELRVTTPEREQQNFDQRMAPDIANDEDLLIG
jgi:hypothetical protein